MKLFENVRSTADYVPSIEVNTNRNGNIDLVYVRTNIKRVEEMTFSGWEYDELQYSQEEYIANLASEEGTGMLALLVSMLMSEVDMLKEQVKQIGGVK